MISKAVIAAGGWSTRFLPTVKVYAKQLVPILNKPQIMWVIEELVNAGITDICLVHRQGEESLNQFFTQNPELDSYLKETGKENVMENYNQMMSKIQSLKFLPQTKDFPYGNGSPILVARDFIGKDSFVYLWGDDLTIENQAGTFLSSMITDYEKYHPSIIAAVTEVPWDQVYRYGTVKFDPSPSIPGKIIGLVEKAPADQAPSNTIQGGRFVVSPKIISVLDDTAVNRGELWFSDAVNHLCQNDLVLTKNYEQNNAQWITTGDPKNWLKANLLLAKNHPDFENLL